MGGYCRTAQLRSTAGLTVDISQSCLLHSPRLETCKIELEWHDNFAMTNRPQANSRLSWVAHIRIGGDTLLQQLSYVIFVASLSWLGWLHRTDLQLSQPDRDETYLLASIFAVAGGIAVLVTIISDWGGQIMLRVPKLVEDIREKAREEGREQGREQGREEGREQGREEVLRELGHPPPQERGARPSNDPPPIC